MHILKRIYKFLLSMTHIRGGTPTAGLKRRMESDQDLLRHWQAEEEMTRALRSGKNPSAPVPATLRDRILDGLEPEAETRIQFRISPAMGWMTSAAAAVFVFGTVMIFVQLDRPPVDVDKVDPAPAPTVEQPTVRPGAPITLQSPIENHPLVKLSAIMESPLREEPQRLLNDAENALRFLSASFVPSKSLRNEVVSSIMGDKSVDSGDSDA